MVGEISHQDGSSLRGVKVLTCYNSLVRQQGVAPTSRDGRELFLISTCVDQLRTGQLALLGDALASRFFALHQASLDGNWNAARNLEIHTPELLSAAGPQLTIAARRHGKLLEKVKSPGEGKKGDGWRRTSWNQTWQPQDRGWYEGKGKTRKGKQKGTDDPWSKAKGRGGTAHQQNWEGQQAGETPKRDKE